MNYYAQGGQAQGIKSLARELPKYGRYNDDMVAHISSDEARLLKSLGGAGTINPVTGLPEFGFFSSITKPFVSAVKSVGDLGGDILKGVEKAVIRPIGDVVKPILPYAQYVAPFIPGVGPLMAAGIGALGSGFAGGGGFNFKRGLMGGMTAYGLSNLYAGLQAANPAAATSVADPSVADVAANLGVEGAASTAPGSQSAMLAEQAAGFGDAGLSNIASSGSYGVNPSANLVGAAADTTAGMADAYAAGNQSIADRAGTYLSNMGKEFTTEMGNAGQGLKNLTGLGETTMTSADAAKAFGTKFGTGSAMGIYGGVTGAAAIDEMEKYKLEEQLANAKSKAEYDAIMADINAAYGRGIETMRANPYMFNEGGDVDGQAGIDDFNEYMGGGITSMAKGGMPPRFLSGGGDGMSDDIKATINGDQPARLADGEFVIPADVVSHLGNGSSKAGAKQLYSMMDKVRSARTGSKKQGKQINAAKFMPA